MIIIAVIFIIWNYSLFPYETSETIHYFHFLLLCSKHINSTKIMRIINVMINIMTKIENQSVLINCIMSHICSQLLLHIISFIMFIIIFTLHSRHASDATSVGTPCADDAADPYSIKSLSSTSRANLSMGILR